MRWAVLILALVAALGLKKALAHDIYNKWRKPDNPGVSCCNDRDCRPTRAYMGDDGLWRAWDGYRWLTIPKEVMLPTDYGQDGRSHLCEIDGHILCFSPGQVRG